MKKYIYTSALVLLVNLTAFAQATIFQDDLEGGFALWTETDDLSPVRWHLSTCAGNGSSLPGTEAFYISPGGINDGCAPGEKDFYGYVNSPSGNQMATVYTSIDASCASDLNLNFDYRIDGVAGEDYGMVLYSIDNGLTWTQVGTDFVSNSNWTASNLLLPASLNNSNFLLAFRFVYSDATIVGNPFAFDNVVVSGTDLTPPVITCPVAIVVSSDVNCEAYTDDYSASMLTLTDNCTDSALIMVTQSIPVGTNLMASPGTNILLTLTATDEAGNSSQCSLSLEVLDTINPTITCPVISNIYLNSNCEASLVDFSSHTLASDNCTPDNSLVFFQYPPAGTIISGTGSTTTVSMFATDDYSNTTQCNFTLTHIDTISATIICPADQSIFANSSCDAALADYTSLAIATDNCAGGASLSVTQSPPPGALISDTTQIQLSVSGGNPSGSNSCVFSVNLIDTTGPSLLCPTSLSVYADNNCLGILPDYTASVGSSDNCGGTVTYSQSPLPGVTVSDAQQITITGTDQFGNTGTCSFQQMVIDTVRPAMNCTGSVAFYADAACDVLIGDISGLVSFSDNCTPLAQLLVSQNPVIGTTVSSGGFITLTVEDLEGNSNSCNFAYTVNDTIKPVLDCNTPIVDYADNSCELLLGDYSSEISVTDNCTSAGFFTFNQSPAPGTLISNSSSQVILIEATDEAGNMQSCSFTISILDTVSPQITACPGNQNEFSNANCEGIAGDYTALFTATDNCTSTLTYSQSPVAGTTISDNEAITMTATDAEGNDVNCIFYIQLIDTVSPIAVCPPDSNVIVSSGCNYTVPDFSAEVSGSDNCTASGSLVYSQNPLAGSTSSGNTTLTVTFLDSQGNSGNCSLELIPIDTITPTIACPGDQTENIGSNCDLAILNYIPQATALDNCSGLNIFQNPVSGTVLPVGEHLITITTTDQGGNSASCSFNLEIIENVNPDIVCPADISTCDQFVTFADATGSDNCLFDIERLDNLSFESGDAFPTGTTTLSFIAIDTSGNSATCSFDITVLQNPSPAIILTQDISLCNSGSAFVEASAPTHGSGEWSLLSGSGNFNNQFAAATQITGIGMGTNQFVWTVTSVDCGSVSDTIEVIVYANPSTANISQDSTFICSAQTTFLLATAPLTGNGFWTSMESNPIQGPSSPTTTSLVLTEGWNTYIWTVTNGVCFPSRDSIRIFRTIKPQINIQDTSLCDSGLPLQLEVNNINVPNEGAWTVSQGNLLLSDYFSNVTNTLGKSTGMNMLIYQSQQYQCADLSDTAYIEVQLCDGYNPDIPTVMTPNNDGKNDYFIIENLASSYPTSKILIFNRWGSVVFESTGYADPWDGTFKGEPLPMGTYFYNIDLDDAEGTVLKGSISLIR